MLFIETPYFTRFCEEHCDADDLRNLQRMLLKRPDAGDLIVGTKGLRKLRWALQGRGKSGGARVIYYWQSAEGRTYLLYAYAKNAQSDLTDAQRKLLVQWIHKELDHE